VKKKRITKPETPEAIDRKTAEWPESLPEGRGLSFVLSIRASRARSWHWFKAEAEADIRKTPVKTYARPQSNTRLFMKKHTAAQKDTAAERLILAS
jgi:hypothetical protein